MSEESLRADEAEDGVIGGMLLQRDAIPAAIDVLGRNGRCFRLPKNQYMYEAILAVFSTGCGPCDAVTAANELDRRGRGVWCGAGRGGCGGADAREGDGVGDIGHGCPPGRRRMGQWLRQRSAACRVRWWMGQVPWRQ